jgi:hypothetical protein
MLLLITGVSAYRMFTRDWQAEPDNQGLALFVGLLAALTLLDALAPLG